MSSQLVGARRLSDAGNGRAFAVTRGSGLKAPPFSGEATRKAGPGGARAGGGVGPTLAARTAPVSQAVTEPRRPRDAHGRAASGLDHPQPRGPPTFHVPLKAVG